MSSSEQPRFKVFCERLSKLSSDTGAMADLRCALIPNREQRAWPYVAEFFSLENERERQIALTVAGAFGMQPEQTERKENMGDVMRRIALGNDKQKGLQTFALRFQRILNCSTPGELIPLLRGIFSVVKSQNIPLNHEELLKDLTYWSDSVKVRWAAHYYAAEIDKETENA